MPPIVTDNYSKPIFAFDFLFLENFSPRLCCYIDSNTNAILKHVETKFIPKTSSQF